MKVLRSARTILLPMLAALSTTALVGGLLLASPAPASHSRLGQTLALQASLRALSHGPAKTFQDFGVPKNLRRGTDGRFIYNKSNLMRAGAIVSRAASGAAQVDEAVQTFDAFNPPPAFTPTQTLTPTNLTPVWTADQTMLIFSSNRTTAGAAGTRFHIWAIPINGGTPVQLTDSTGPTGGGEFFPALSATNNQTLAFTSDADTPGVQNLYSMPFTATTVTVTALPASPTNIPAFGGVGRMAFSPNDAAEVIFTAVSATGTNPGHSHLYFLFLNTGGFDPSNPSAPAQITDGPADDTDPAYSQDGLAIAFASTAAKLTATGQSPSSDPNVSLIATSTPGTTRNIFVIGGGGSFGFSTVLNSGNPVTTIGTDNFAPAWSSQARNPFLNPISGQEYIAFSRGASSVTPHDIYYILALKNNATTGAPQLFAEGSTILPAVPATSTTPVIPALIDTAVQLNTSDPANAYDDIYPTWSPFTSVFSIAYSSNRTVTYNDPATTSPSETAISIADGGSLGTGATVGTLYRGLLESQVLNLDPPTLLPYSGNEIIHVANSAGQIARGNLTPGQPVTLTVRLSDREAGIDDSNVYVQIKDPESKYQDPHGLEHKVFAKDAEYRSQSNAPALLDSGTSTLLMNGGGYRPFNQFTSSASTIYFLDNRGSSAGIEGPEAFLSGTAVASDTAVQNDNPIGNISIGRSGGGTNAEHVFTATGGPVTDPNTKTVVTNPPGSDPTLFIPWGPEFECQVVNPAFATDTSPTGDVTAADFRDPFYLAGVDDQLAFSGAGKVRPTTNGTDAVSGAAAPAEWLQLTRLPSDGQGGLLYSVNWTTPTSGTDFYLDVIAFDKAVAPAVYSATEARLVPTVTTGGNWRIYDNIGGFSTASSIGNNDILVVSDYALGQKFAATTFGGATGFVNLVPKLYGAESYVTDVDVDILPDAIYRHYVITGANVDDPNTEVLDLGGIYSPAGGDSAGANENPPLSPFLNGLGVGSYVDEFIDDGSRRPATTNYPSGIPDPPSQEYSIWRVLSRGPIPASVYASYEPKPVSEPAVNDPSTKVIVPAGSALNATRCIVWLSPFTGDVLAGSGTLTDSATQNSLRSFVKAGGRLCITGQDVGSSLTQNGTANNTTGGFLPDVLNATLVTSNGGTHLPANGAVATDNRLTFSPSYDDNLIGNFEELIPNFDTVPISLRDRLIRVSNNFGGNLFESAFIVDLRNYPNWRTDGSLDQLGPYPQAFSLTGTGNNAGLGETNAVTNSSTVVGQIDTVTPGTGAHVDQTLAPFVNQISPVQFGNVNAASAPGGAGLIYTETPLTAAGGGSKVVYATFGLEGVSSEFYRRTASFKPNYDTYQVRNVRQGLIHNIVSYLRTGTITGTIRSTSGNGVVGSGISGATIYLQSGLGPTIPGRGTFSATTDSAGNYSIVGIEPGSYTLAAYRTGFIGTTSNKGVLFVVEGDTTQSANLTLSTANPGTVTGTVTDNTASKNVVPGATVSFTSTDGQTYTALTNANGVYTLTTIPPATYIGTATKAGFGIATSASTVVTTGSTTTVNFTLVPGPGSATGRVLDSSGNPIASATVFFTGNGLLTPATATTATDGTYTVPSLSPGSYSVAASATGYGTSSPIIVTITSSTTTTVPDIILGVAVNGTLGGLVTATGSTTALMGVTVTAVNTANQQATTATTTTASSPAAPAGDGSPLNYTLSLLQGTYTVTASENGVVTASQTVTVPPNGFARADFTGTSGLQPVYTFPAGIQFVSTPYDYSALGFSGLFGALNTAATGTTPNGNRSNVAVWNPLTGAYALDPTAPADALRPGVGYWVYLKSATAVTQTGTVLTGSVKVALNPAWNQIGVPSTAGVAVNSLTFAGSDGASRSFADATGSAYHLVSPLLYSYNGTAYVPVSAGATLQPWQAYWIRVYAPVTLSIPTGK
ncbi:MAG: carboxypeptidase regulatory-like domain-containing protein [Janthinobacterium lividum]